MKTNHRPPTGSRGFSLVEVVLALGVASFALVSILGLLNVALESDSSASRDTTLSTMAGHVLNDLRTVPFDALWAAEPQTSRDAAPATTETAVAPTVFYFTKEGAPVAAANVGGNFDVLYQCTVTKTPDLLTRNADTHICNQLKLQLEFAWPVTASGNTLKGGTQSIYASIARH